MNMHEAREKTLVPIKLPVTGRVAHLDAQMIQTSDYPTTDI